MPPPDRARAADGRGPARSRLSLAQLEKEQRGKRFVFVLSPSEHNKRGLAVVLPTSQGLTLARSTGFASSLIGTGLDTQGVIICDQPRTLDMGARSGRYVESAPDYVTLDVPSRIGPLVT